MFSICLYTTNSKTSNKSPSTQPILLPNTLDEPILLPNTLDSFR